jgi:antitoxin PrlF
MPAATLTTKGQLTLPKAVRAHLRVDAGDTVDFVFMPGGQIHVRAGQVDVAELQGMLKRPGRKAASLEAMDAAIARGLSSRT